MRLDTSRKRKTSMYQMTGDNYDNVNGGLSHAGYPDWFYEGQKALKGRCLWCGDELENKRRKYCDNRGERPDGTYNVGCHFEAYRHFGNLQINVGSVRRHVHQRDNFQCQDGCGYLMIGQAPSGLLYPRYSGHVDHIIPLFLGGLDELDNLQLLKDECHDKKTREERLSKPEPQSEEGAA